MNIRNKPLHSHSNKNQDVIVRSLPKIIIGRLYRLMSTDQRRVNLPYIQQDGLITDGIRTDPAALSTRTLLSSKRSLR